jgi:hypothetical protein
MDNKSPKALNKTLATSVVALVAFFQGLQAEPLPNSTAQEQAAFLAGIPLGKSSPLFPYQRSQEYRQYQKDLQEQWAFCRQVRYGAMQLWARDHLSRLSASHGVLRYLFGGPDFLNAYAFFPDTRVMVLGGLEPVGEVPPPEALDPTALGTALKALNEALHTSLFCGYFITSEMKPQLVQGSFQGVLPVLYTELALTGNMIDSVTAVRPFGAPGVEISYHRLGGQVQTLYYFQADLSNGKECRRFLAWLGELGPGATYLKAASYLLPLDSFSETRNFLLQSSSLILQDDSGLPFRSFLPGEWKIQLFGVYTDPLPIFKLHRDLQLDEAHRSEIKAEPLPFGAGYHVRADDANLLLAIRNASYSFFPGESAQAVQAPPAIPAFVSPTPKPKHVRIRKALPVPVKKAIAVPSPVSQGTPLLVPAPTQEQMIDSPHEPSTNSALKPHEPLPSEPMPESGDAPSVAIPSPTPEPSSTPSALPAAAEEKASLQVTAVPLPAAFPEATPGSTLQATPEAQAKEQAPQTLETSPSQELPETTLPPESAPLMPEKAPDSTNG